MGIVTCPLDVILMAPSRSKNLARDTLTVPAPLARTEESESESELTPANVNAGKARRLKGGCDRDGGTKGESAAEAAEAAVSGEVIRLTGCRARLHTLLKTYASLELLRTDLA